MFRSRTMSTHSANYHLVLSLIQGFLLGAFRVALFLRQRNADDALKSRAVQMIFGVQFMTW